MGFGEGRLGVIWLPVNALPSQHAVLHTLHAFSIAKGPCQPPTRVTQLLGLLDTYQALRPYTMPALACRF